MKQIAAAKFKEQCLAILDDCLLDRDQLIAATSVVHHVPLLTRDRRLRRSRMVPLA